MLSPMERPRLILKPREDIRLRGGHPWVYDNEVAAVEGSPTPGAEVEVLDSRRTFVGSAFFNPASKIRARIYSRDPRPADGSYFVERIGDALAWRRRFFDIDRQSLRLVYGEADGIPGLIVDSFIARTQGSTGSPVAKRRWLSIQFLSRGVDLRRDEILDALAALCPSAGFVERSEAPVRALEGLPPAAGLISGAAPTDLVIEENGLGFKVNLLEGQKTGWFHDQRANRAATARYVHEGRGLRVLDAFSNAGGFGLACAAAGAGEVICVDASADAVAAVHENASLNDLAEKTKAVEANVFDFLRGLERDRERFGLIILDPPAFAKNRAAVESAHRGYRDLNLRAMRILGPQGILVSCSCSHWFDRERFSRMLEEAARDAGRRLRILEERTQDLDHPIVTGYEESRYLKCVIAAAD